MRKTTYIWIEFIVFLIFLIPIVVNDIRNHRIPDILIFTCLSVIIILRCIFKYNFSLSIILELFIGFFFIWVLWFLTKGKIGLGDAKLSALMAMILGLANWFVAIFFASAIGSLFGLVKIWKSRMKTDEILPFAPFLAIGSIFSFFLGDYLVRKLYGISF